MGQGFRVTTTTREPFLINGFFHCLRVALFVLGFGEPPCMAVARNTLNCAFTNPRCLAGLAGISQRIA
jgi:hypothetical protein